MNLQLIILLIGLLLVVAIYLFSRWQQQRSLVRQLPSTPVEKSDFDDYDEADKMAPMLESMTVPQVDQMADDADYPLPPEQAERQPADAADADYEPPPASVAMPAGADEADYATPPEVAADAVPDAIFDAVPDAISDATSDDIPELALEDVVEQNWQPPRATVAPALTERSTPTAAAPPPPTESATATPAPPLKANPPARAPNRPERDKVAAKTTRATNAAAASPPPTNPAAAAPTRAAFAVGEVAGFDKLSQLDYWVKLPGERDVSRDSVLAVYRQGVAGLSKHHTIYGLRMPGKTWCDLETESEDARFIDLVITIQLADRHGPVSAAEMTQFTDLVARLSASTGRGFAFMAPVASAMQQAARLAEFMRHYDSVSVINVKPLEMDYFPGALIDQCACQLGLEREDKHYARFKRVGKSQVCLYSLANMSDSGHFDFHNLELEYARGVTFYTHPAVSRSPGAVFSEMVHTAQAFSARVQGQPIASGGDSPITQLEIEHTRAKIEHVAAEMSRLGIAPGSEPAVRLF